MNITAINTFTPPLLVQAKDAYDVSVSGTFVATVTIQRSKDLITWMDVESVTAPAERTTSVGTGWYVRAGIKTTYTSGTAVVEVYNK